MDDASMVPLPALLRVARRTYGWAMKEALDAAGCDDIPRNGMYVIGGIARTGTKHGEIVRELALTKQAASQLIDTLVLRGYITRAPDPNDRRKVLISLSERGELAAEASRNVVDAIDDRLEQKAGHETVLAMRKGLAELIDINDEHFGLPRGKR